MSVLCFVRSAPIIQFHGGRPMRRAVFLCFLCFNDGFGAERHHPLDPFGDPARPCRTSGTPGKGEVGCERREKNNFPSPTGCRDRFRGWNLDFSSLADECRGTDHAGGSNPFLREIQRPGRRSRGIRTVTAASSFPEIGAGIRRLSPPIRLELLRGGIENCGCCTQLKLLFRKIDEPEDFFVLFLKIPVSLPEPFVNAGRIRIPRNDL